MPETYLIEFRVKPDRLARFHDLLNGVLDAMRHETTFLNAVLVEDSHDRSRLVLFETWADGRDVVDVQLQRPYRREWHAALDDILSEDRRISIWRPVRADGARIDA